MKRISAIIFSLLLLVTFSFSVIGCSKEAEKKPAETAAPAAAPAPEAAPAAAPAAPEAPAAPATPAAPMAPAAK
jgi:hypothetical protein